MGEYERLIQTHCCGKSRKELALPLLYTIGRLRNKIGVRGARKVIIFKVVVRWRAGGCSVENRKQVADNGESGELQWWMMGPVLESLWREDEPKRNVYTDKEENYYKLFGSRVTAIVQDIKYQLVNCPFFRSDVIYHTSVVRRLTDYVPSNPVADHLWVTKHIGWCKGYGLDFLSCNGE